MATYFHGAPEIQADGLQTLYLMNPGYIGYSDASNQAGMVFLNSAANSLNPVSLSQTTQPSHQQQQLLGIPVQTAVSTLDPSRPPPSVHSSHEISSIPGLVPHLHYNQWAPTPASNSGDMMAQRRQTIAPQSQQGLSLSLSPQQPTYGSYQPEPRIQALPVMSPVSGDEVRMGGSSASASWVSNGRSKYLKVAQQLLDEVVNVGKGITDESPKVAKSHIKMNREAEGINGGESTLPLVAELTTAERQELQMKKAKLVNMLDELEQRYRQYHHQMQIVVSSFEAAAVFGSARTYTALALQTISRQFRCLRDAISGQIRATSNSLGEEDCLGGGTKAEGSRLRFVDHHLRQQRALQQIGMIQHNAWRPQRGLPERSVSVLRAWLFEHFLHPYPKDSDKHMLAKQTGLTRSQVSNWFINARVRLWKPMVEEMYLEETKEQEQQNNADDRSKREVKDSSSSKSSVPQESSPTRTEETENPKPPPIMIPSLGPSANIQMRASYNDTDAIAQARIKKARSEEELLHPNTFPHSMNVGMDLKHDEFNNRDLFMKFGDGRRGSSSDQGYSLITGASNNGGSFGAYSIGEIGRFDPEQFAPRFSGNGVSLTLGLPHCDSISLSGAQQSYLSDESIPLGRRLEMSSETTDYCSLNNNPSVAHSSNAYESINIQNRKRFSAQLLPDFVA